MRWRKLAKKIGRLSESFEALLLLLVKEITHFSSPLQTFVVTSTNIASSGLS